MSTTPDPADTNTAASHAGAEAEAGAGVDADTDAGDHCENCDAPLQGHFCHQCGQSVINPVRHAKHALEDVFESFWHLDGRVFRTLHDLLVPARVACDYLAGHRARYIAPLRLFVVLSVLTFFVAQFTIQLDQSTVLLRNDAADAADTADTQAEMGRATTVAEVERLREQALQQMALAKADLSAIPGAAMGMDAAMAEMRAQARRRIQVLQAAEGTLPATATPPATAVPGKAPGSTAPGIVVGDEGDWVFSGGKPWHEQRNPLTLPGAPGFVNSWFNRQIGKAKGNMPRIKQDPNLYKNAAIGAIPTTLFVLVPIFALLLKLAYLRQRRLYLEHLVVGLYSHAFLFVALLAMLVLVGLDHWLAQPAPWTGAVFGLLEAALWVWMPLYLLLMQKRVYAQGWPMTIFKYLLLGGLYFMLVMFAMPFVVVTSFVRV